MVIIEAISALGGLVAFIGAIVLIVRSIFRLVDSNDDNTIAVKTLTNEVKELNQHCQDMDRRIARLEGRGENGRHAVH